MELLLFDWIALIYFVACAVFGARSVHRARGFALVAAAIALVIVARFALPWEARAWMPHAYLVLGYWIPAAFAPPLNTGFEAWLRRADGALGLGRWTLGVTWDLGFGIWELAYLLCYPLVPAAFLMVFIGGTRADVMRFWLSVLLAGYCCYGTLPWTAARPPRIIAADHATRSGLSAFNARVLGLVSHNLNTFPSGHVAVAIAAGLAVWPVSTWGGTLVLGLAAAIVVAAVAGRYHFGVDVLAGMGVGAAAAAVAVGIYG